MSVLELSAVAVDGLRGADLTLDAGVHAVLGAPADGTSELVAVATGIIRARRGRVRVQGQDPFSSPEARRSTAALLPEERLIPARSVAASVARALALAGEKPGTQDDALAALGLGSWANRRPASLGAGELRAVALSLALARPKPSVVALYEPLGVPGVTRQVVLDAMARLAAAGACVLCVTASARDAGEASSTLHLLHRGRFVRRATLPLPTELAPGTTPDFVVQSDDPRRLAAALSAESVVAGVEWNQEQSPDEIRVRGTDAAELALVIARVAVAAPVRVRAVSPALPSLDVVHGASDGLARSAYEQAYYLAQAQARAALRVEPRRGVPGAPLYAPPSSQPQAPPIDREPPQVPPSDREPPEAAPSEREGPAAPPSDREPPEGGAA